MPAIVAEMWLYPDGSRILELSTKAMPIEAFQVAAAFRAFLAKKGIEVNTVQETKTMTALDYFSARLPRRRGQPARASAASDGRRASRQSG